MYLILAVEYPIDDTQTVNELRFTAIELLKKLPISNKNQVVDSHLNTTVNHIIDMVSFVSLLPVFTNYLVFLL